MSSDEATLRDRLTRGDGPSLRWTWHAEGRVSPELREVTARDARLDPSTVDFFWNLSDEDHGRACFEGVRRERASLGRPPRPEDADASTSNQAQQQPIGPHLERAVEVYVRGRRPAVALSGGLDSAAVLACAIDLGVRDAYVLEPVGMPGYSERERALATGNALGARVTVVEAPEEAFVASLPACVAAAGVPFYNLHPVGKYLLARRVAADGYDTLLTGDGADEAASHKDGERWLPIAAALSEAGGARLACPFTHPGPRGSFSRPDPEKRALRSWLDARVPDLARAPKVARWAPAMDLSRHLHELAPLARELGREVSLTTDAERVRWATLALLARHVRG